MSQTLRDHPRLRLRPNDSDATVLAGTLRCWADGVGGLIDEVYRVELWIPPAFPRATPIVFETAGRIPKSFHHLENGALCLGSPTKLRLVLQEVRTIGGFLDAVLVPYLYGYACHERSGAMPFGELAHGAAGLESELLQIFGVARGADVLRLVELAGLRRRDANKHACPCGRGIRLGCCHHLQVNAMRTRLGRSWWRVQADLIRRQRSLEHHPPLSSHSASRVNALR